MRLRNTILLFALKLIVIYGLFLVPWPGLDKAYLSFFRTMGHALFSEFGSTGKVLFKPEPHASGKWNSEMILSNPRNKVAMQRIYQTRQGYLATALTLTLVLATPLTGKRKWKALLVAFLLINLFLIFRLWLGLLDSFSEERMAVVHLGPFAKQTVRLGVTIFLISPEATFFVPIFVWIVATFRRGDLARWGIAPTSARGDSPPKEIARRNR